MQELWFAEQLALFHFSEESVTHHDKSQQIFFKIMIHLRPVWFLYVTEGFVGEYKLCYVSFGAVNIRY